MSALGRPLLIVGSGLAQRIDHPRPHPRTRINLLDDVRFRAAVTEPGRVASCLIKAGVPYVLSRKRVRNTGWLCQRCGCEDQTVEVVARVNVTELCNACCPKRLRVERLFVPRLFARVARVLDGENGVTAATLVRALRALRDDREAQEALLALIKVATLREQSRYTAHAEPTPFGLRVSLSAIERSGTERVEDAIAAFVLALLV